MEHCPNTSTTRVPIQKRESSKTAGKLLINAGGDESESRGVYELLIDSKMKAFIRDPENEDNRKAVIQLMTCDALPDGDGQLKKIRMELPHYINYK